MSRTPTPTGRAVVLGGSLAGLLAASVLARHVTDVVVVDRDDLDAELTAPRRGVPQSKHTHGLLVRGARAFDELLPGLKDELVARGAIEGDVLTRCRWLMSGNVLSQNAPGLAGLLASRTLIESQVRVRVAAVPNVRFRSRHDIVGLRTDEGRIRVTGAVVAPRDPSPTGPVSVELPADIVVDATGRGTRTPAWLEALGLPVPPKDVVEARCRYMTRLFRVRPGVLDELDADIVGTDPVTGRSGVVLRQEGDCWTVSLAGQFGAEPPGDLDGFRAYARSLPTPGIAAVVEACEPIGGPEPFTFPASRWRHWEKLRQRLAGLVVIGDAVCSFNPVYGQGMSSATQQVLALRDILDRHGTSRLEQRCPEAFASVVATPWTLATGMDRRFPGQPPKAAPERLIDRYLDRLLAVATEDPRSRSPSATCSTCSPRRRACCAPPSPGAYSGRGQAPRCGGRPLLATSACALRRHWPERTDQDHVVQSDSLGTADGQDALISAATSSSNVRNCETSGVAVRLAGRWRRAAGRERALAARDRWCAEPAGGRAGTPGPPRWRFRRKPVPRRRTR